MQPRFLPLFSIALGIFTLAGCGPGGPSTVPVSGTVTYQGQPVDGARIMFVATGGPPANGVTDAQGRFSLTTVEPGDGAVVGSYKVSITKRQEIPDPRQPDSPYKLTKDLLPARYSNLSQTDLTAEVKAGGPNDFKFELKD